MVKYDAHDTQRKKCVFFSAHNKCIHQLPEIREAALLCQLVGVVSMFVHYAVGLQGSGTLLEDSGQLLQAILCGKVKKSGKLLVPFI